MGQVALDFDAVALKDSDYKDLAEFVRELVVQFSNRSFDVEAQDKPIKQINCTY